MSLDVGSLTGEVSIEDQFSGALDRLSNAALSKIESLSGAFGTIGLAAIGAGTAILGVTAAITALGSRGADVNDVADTVEQFAGSAQKADEILKALQRGTLDTIDNFTLLKDAAKLLSTGVKLTTTDFETLGQAAFIMQNRGLGSTKEMLDLVSNALVTGRTRTLAMKLNVADIGDATVVYANSLNKLVSELTSAEKQEAKRVGVMSILNSATKNAGVLQRDFGEQLEFAKTQILNWTDALAQQVAKSPDVMNAVNAIGKALMDAFGGTSEAAIKTIVGWIDAFANGVAKWFPIVLKAMTDVAGGIRAIYDAVMSVWDAVPEFFKIIAVDAGKAVLAIYAVSGALLVLSSSTVISSIGLLAKGLGAIGAGIVTLVSSGGLGTFGATLRGLIPTMATLAASPFFMASLFTALAAGVWQVIQAFRGLGDTLQASGGWWGILTLKDDDTFINSRG